MGAGRHRILASKSVRRGKDETGGKGKGVIKIKNRKCEGITAEIRSMAKNCFR